MHLRRSASFSAIHVTSNFIRPISDRPNLHDVTQSSSGTSPLINDQIGNDIVTVTTAAHIDDYDYQCASSSSSSSPNQQHVSVEIGDTKEPLELIGGGICSTFKEHEIGKTVMGYVPSALVALLLNKAAIPHWVVYTILIALCVGYAITWNGIMLRKKYEGLGCVAEQVGVVTVIFGFLALMATFLPLAICWAPVLCGIVILVPLIEPFYCNLVHKISSCKNIATPPPPLLPITNC